MLDLESTRLKTEEYLNYEGLGISFEEIEPELLKLKTHVEDLSYAINSYEIFTNLENIEVKSEDLKDIIMYTCSKTESSFSYYSSPLKTENYNFKSEEFKEFANKLLGWIKDLWGKINEFFKKAWTKVQAAYYTLTAEMFELRKLIYGLRDKRNIKLPKERLSRFLRDFSSYLHFKDVYKTKHPGMFMGVIAGHVMMYLDHKQIEARLELLRRFTKTLQNNNVVKDIKLDMDKNDEKMLENTYSYDIRNIFRDVYRNSFKFLDKTDYKTQNDEEIEFPFLASLRPSMGQEGFKIMYINKNRKIKTQSDLIMPDVEEILKQIEGHEEYISIDYSTMQRLAESIDECKGFINNVTSDVFALDKTINQIYDKLEENDSELIKRITSDILAMTRTFCSEFIMSILDHIKISSKWCRRIHKAASESTNLGVIEFYNRISKSKPGEAKIIEFPINAPNEVKLVENSRMCYIDPGKTFWKELYTKMGAVSPAFAIVATLDMKSVENNLKESGVSSLALFEMSEKEKIARAEIEKQKTFMSGSKIPEEGMIGLILINEKAILNDKTGINSLFKFQNTNTALDFIYYHELGHLLTGQSETFEKFNIDKNGQISEIDLKEGFIRYAFSSNENKADAFACHCTGVSPKQITENRYKMALIEYIDDDDYGPSDSIDVLESEARGNIHRDLFNKLLEAKIAMEKNITNRMSEMKDYVDLSIFEGFKKLLRSNLN